MIYFIQEIVENSDILVDYRSKRIICFIITIDCLWILCIGGVTKKI